APKELKPDDQGDDHAVYPPGAYPGFLGCIILIVFFCHVKLRIVAALHHRYLGISPKSLNVVEFPNVLLKYMYDHVHIVHQYPLRILGALDVPRLVLNAFADGFLDGGYDCVYMRIGSTVADNEVVAN